MWKDAAGTVVTGAFMFPLNSGKPMAFADSGGAVWSVDTWSGDLSPGVQTGLLTYYVAADCSGTAYVDVESFPTPGIVFEYGYSSGSYKAIPTNISGIANRTFSSYLFAGGSCSPTSEQAASLPESTISALPDLTPPGAFTPPFHFEPA